MHGLADSPKENLWQAPAAAALCQQHRNLEGLALINKGTKAGPGGRSSVSNLISVIFQTGMLTNVPRVCHPGQDSPHRSPRARPHAPSSLKGLEGSPHALSTFSEHLTAALATGLHA